MAGPATDLAIARREYDFIYETSCQQRALKCARGRDRMAAALVWLVGVNFMLFFAKSVGMIVAGTVLIGLSWGGELKFQMKAALGLQLIARSML